MLSQQPKWIRLGLGLIAASVLLGCSLFSPVDFETGNPPVLDQPIEPSAGRAQIGRMWTTTGVDENSCPVDQETVFRGDEPIYVAAELLEAQPGVRLMARWSREGQPFEDTPVITTDRAYQDQCLEFHITPDRPLPSGAYDVTLYVNGQPVERAEFQVR